MSESFIFTAFIVFQILRKNSEDLHVYVLYLGLFNFSEEDPCGNLLRIISDQRHSST